LYSFHVSGDHLKRGILVDSFLENYTITTANATCPEIHIYERFEDFKARHFSECSFQDFIGNKFFREFISRFKMQDTFQSVHKIGQCFSFTKVLDFRVGKALKVGCVELFQDLKELWNGIKI
jgi:hypothetical protein